MRTGEFIRNRLAAIKPAHSRTLNIGKNIAVSFVLKGTGIGASLLLVPLTLNYLDKERYGLWLSLSSIIGWFSLFDMGLGNGFRNRFAEAAAVRNDDLAKTCVSTTFALLCMIMGCVLAVFAAVNPFLDWGKILNTGAESRGTLSLLAMTLSGFFALRFVFSIVTTMFVASQKPALADLTGVCGSLLTLAIVFLITRVNGRPLLLLGTALSAGPVLALAAAYCAAFSGNYAKYRPSLKHIDFRQSKSLMGLGLMFFIPQICALIVFSTSNVIISRLFSPSEVTVYNVAFRYFSVVTLFFNIVITPFWSAFTEASAKNDGAWIKNMIHKLIVVWGISCLGTLAMVMASKFAYRVWVGPSITVPFSLTAGMGIYVCVGNWNNIFVQYIAGTGRMAVQAGLSLFGGIVFIPAALLLSKTFGLAGIPYSMMLSIILGSFVVPLQYKKLTGGKAKGVWNR